MTDDAESSIPILEFLIVLVSNKRLLFGLPLAAGVLAAAIVFALPNWYTASAKIMPPQQTQSAALAIIGQLSGLAGNASQALGLKNPSEVYVSMLKTRTVADNLIEKFELRKVYDEELLHFARKELASNSAITTSRDGIITIEVDDKDPKRAADLANAYIDELRDLTGQLAVSEAGQRRVFFESQLKKARGDLAAAELELKKFTQEAGLINPQSQITLSVAAAATLQAQIAAKEIQLTTMRTFSTEANPEMKRTLQELNGLRAELAKMQRDTASGKGDVLVPFGKAPEIGLEYVRRYRDTKYYETLFEVLAKQYEIARIDEAKEAAIIQVLDPAVTPERKSKPKRALIIGLSILLGLFLAIVVAVAKGYFNRIRSNAAVAIRLDELRRRNP